MRRHTTRHPGREVEAQVRGTDKCAVATAYVEACARAADRARNARKFGDDEDC